MRALALAILVAGIVITMSGGLAGLAAGRLAQRDQAALGAMLKTIGAQALTTLQADVKQSGPPANGTALPTYTYNPCGSGACGASGTASCVTGTGTATGTNQNSNATLGEKEVGVNCGLQLSVGGATVAATTVHLTYATFKYAPFAKLVNVASATNHVNGTTDLVSGEASTLGCDPSTPSSCQTVTDPSLANSTYYTDTRPHVVPSCTPGADATECTSAGTTIPTDAFTTGTWATNPQ